ncbi:MAG TPA: flagellar basal body P-ring formation chaperone FlgA, partial [Planctomycetota bacterium]|nr:flagellar basal body P-ring formation chaperone FlgA [Planctomycetota bacterium]
VQAELEGVRRVVVARRALAAGSTIRERDVEIARVDGASAPTDAFEKPDLVVGERLAKPVSAGGPITPDSLAKPVLVGRGDMCRMTIRGRGFRIMGEARARENGSIGDTIAMESLKERRRFAATVTGRREVEVRLAKEEN